MCLTLLLSGIRSITWHIIWWNHISILLIPVSSLCVRVCVCVYSWNLPTPFSVFTSYLLKTCTQYQGVTWMLFHNLRSNVKITRSLKFWPICICFVEGFGGSNILPVTAMSIHTWAAFVPKTEVADDSYCNYKGSRKQLVFWDTTSAVVSVSIS